MKKNRNILIILSAILLPILFTILENIDIRIINNFLEKIFNIIIEDKSETIIFSLILIIPFIGILCILEKIYKKDKKNIFAYIFFYLSFLSIGFNNLDEMKNYELSIYIYEHEMLTQQNKDFYLIVNLNPDPIQYANNRIKNQNVIEKMKNNEDKKNIFYRNIFKDFTILVILFVLLILYKKNFFIIKYKDIFHNKSHKN